MGTSNQPGQGLVSESGPSRAGLCRDLVPGRAPEGGRFDGWLAVLDRYGVQYLILDKERDGRLLSLVRSRPGWTVGFEDEASVLFSRIGEAELLDTVQSGQLFSLQPSA